MNRVWEKEDSETKTHVLCVRLRASEWNIRAEVSVCVCVCPGTCEVVCGRREGKLIKPMITLMRSRGVKPEKAFHFLSHSIPLSPTSISPSLLSLLLFFNSNAEVFLTLCLLEIFRYVSPDTGKKENESFVFVTDICIQTNSWFSHSLLSLLCFLQPMCWIIMVMNFI